MGQIKKSPALSMGGDSGRTEGPWAGGSEAYCPVQLDDTHLLIINSLPTSQKCGSDPRPPHTRQKHEQKSGQNLTPMLQNKANSTVLGPYFCSYFGLVCGGWGLKMIPQPRHPKNGSDSQIACEPVYEPHPGPRSIVDLASLSGKKQTSPR